MSGLLLPKTVIFFPFLWFSLLTPGNIIFDQSKEFDGGQRKTMSGGYTPLFVFLAFFFFKRSNYHAVTSLESPRVMEDWAKLCGGPSCCSLQVLGRWHFSRCAHVSPLFLQKCNPSISIMRIDWCMRWEKGFLNVYYFYISLSYRIRLYLWQWWRYFPFELN